MTVYIILIRKIRSNTMSKTGLVLEGGAMRGLFTAGVMDTLMEKNIRFDGLIGVSAGAAFGCNYKSRQIGRVLRYNKRFCRDKRYCSLFSLLKTGDLFGADFCYRRLPDELDPFDRETYNNDPMAFYLVCTDVHTGLAHYQSCPVVDEKCFEWMRASASMPLVSRIVKVENGEYLDGAIADSIPLRFFETQGYSKNVVVLTQPAGFNKKASKAMGQSPLKIILKHFLPNVLSYLIVGATLSIPAYILGEAALSFLGLGIQEPSASWGLMLAQAQNDTKVLMLGFWWLLSPGVAIFATVLAFNMLGDILRDIADPKKEK